MRKIQSLTNWNDVEARLLKDPEVKALYDALEPEYQIARSLIEMRLKRKMSQKQLAERIGTKQPVISRIESMTAHPTVSLLQKISHALDAKLRISFRENK